MRAREGFHTAPDGKELKLYSWEPARERARGVVQIAHGMAEHARRYERVAAALTSRGFAVVANDHRGHGQTDPQALGQFAGEDAFHRMADDIASLHAELGERYPGAPRWLFGHSMGAALVLRAAGLRGLSPSGLIISGPPGGPRAPLVAMAVLSRVAGGVLGEAGMSPGIDALWSAPAKLKFRPRRTPFDWLSGDPAEVDAYARDPACGFVFTRAFYRDLFRGILAAFSRENIRKLSEASPVYVFAGKADPVGFSGAAAERIARELGRAGVPCTLRLYDGGRHEMLNDVQREAVTAELLAWLERSAAGAGAGDAPAGEGGHGPVA